MYWNEIPRRVLESVLGLTLTWDVLKCPRRTELAVNSFRLTLTWDVLKSRIFRTECFPRNGLTLTWDVLKCFGKTEATTSKED